MAVINPFPKRYMRGLANSHFSDTADIYRNDGYGWNLVGHTRCSIHHRITPPTPADPSDASAANVEFVEVHMPRSIPIRIGDRIHARGQRWTVGGGNLSETYGSFMRALAGRPISATPLTYITLRRYNQMTGLTDVLAPQLVHVAWSKNQPDRLGGISVRQFGWIFAEDGNPDNLDVQQGDTFFYGGTEGFIQWVPPDPTERREAIFFTNIGEGT